MIAANREFCSLDSTAPFSRRPVGLRASRVSTERARSRHVVVRNLVGEITHVQISRWRRVTAGPRRRIADVVELHDGVAVLIERRAHGDRTLSSAWQAYDDDGRLTAVLQLSANNRHALLINYQTREVCQLTRNESGEMQTVDSWRL